MKIGVITRIAASIATMASFSASVPATANDAGAYIRHALECKWLLLTDWNRHHQLCSDGEPIDPESLHSISPTGTGSPPPVEEVRDLVYL